MFFSNVLGEGNSAREGTFVGTPLYVAPEMLEANKAGRFTDLWALGCIIYEMLDGSTPFHGNNYDEVFQKILQRQLFFSPSMDDDAIDIINMLLQTDPEKRLGYNSYQELKSHPFFKGIKFDKLEKKELEIPNIEFLRKETDPKVVDDLKA